SRAHQACLGANGRIPDLALQLRSGNQSRHGIHYYDVQRVGADQRLADPQRFLTRARLRDEQIVKIHAQSFCVARIQRVLDVDKGCEATALLRLSDDGKCKRCFAGRFRAEDFDYSAARKSTDSESAVDQNVSSRNDIDIDDPFPAQTHDRTFAVIFRDLLDGQVEVLISRGSQFISGCSFFSLCRHIRKNLTTTRASIRQEQKRWLSTDSNEKGASMDARGLKTSTVLIPYETVILRGLTCSALGRINVTRP